MSTKSTEPTKSHKNLVKYWTKERRTKAIPKLRPEVLGKQEDQPEGNGIITPPNSSINDEFEAFASSGCPIATPVTSPATWPNSCNGKLYFNWKGDSYVGSAGSIYLEVLLTAGHCVDDSGEWCTDFLYYPGYPVYGKSWGWSRAAVFIAWQNSTNWAYDYAMILTSSSMKEVGSMGSIRNLSPNGRTWTAFGYPAGPPYKGAQMYKTIGSYVSGSSIIEMSNNGMTGGSSGGNWLTNFNEQDYVNGVNSTDGSSSVCNCNSPYLDNNDFLNLLECATIGNC